MYKLLEGILVRYTNDYTYKMGNSIVERELIKDIGALKSTKGYIINGKIDSEFGNNSYNTKIVIGLSNEGLKSTSCSCSDYEQHNARGNSKYMCKHLIASVIMVTDILKKKHIKKENERRGKVENSGEYLLKQVEGKDEPKEKVNLAVYLDSTNISKSNEINMYFKIGKTKMYVMKDIQGFYQSLNTKEEIKFGKEFTFCPSNSYFSTEDENFIQGLFEYLSIAESAGDSFCGKNPLISGKNIKVTSYSLKRILQDRINKSVNLIIDDKEIECQILNGKVPLDMSLSENNNGMILSLIDELPIKLAECEYVYLYKDKIYIIPSIQKKALCFFYDYFKKNKKIFFKNKDSEKVFNYIIPELKYVSDNFKIDESLENKIIKEEPKFSFYFDKDKGNISCDIKIMYGVEELSFFKKSESSNHIIRDIDKENRLISVLEKFSFYKGKSRFEFDGKENELYNFLKNGSTELIALGEIFYSDSFKNYRIRNKTSLNASIKEKDRGFLEVSFNLDGINKDEIKDIILAIKSNKKFFKLKDESFLDLENQEFLDINHITDVLKEENIEGNSINFHKNKAFFLQDVFDNLNSIKYSGREILLNITNKLKDTYSYDYEVPEELKGLLREYQVTGFRWLKTLKDLGFGGILADEMGLGKTIQTIAFLLSEPNKKTIIVTPTSLIYNWENEFKKFGKSLKVSIVHGSKKERTELVKAIDEVDVILTTYGTLRNDIELYRDKKFDFCIIDEGQNIKNPSALNTETVKEVKSDVRFVLTGTPIENGLLELWSIFDFAMPGYLAGKKEFKERFVVKDNIELLKKLIRPFILRRLKKNVMKELPDKIEKKFYVELGDEQKKIYKHIAEEVKETFETMNQKESRIKVLAAITRLRQICLDPSIIIEDYKGGSGKVDVALELIEGYIKSNDKVLLFSQFTSLLQIMASYLDKAGIGYYYLDGSTKASDRVKLVNQFNEGDEKSIFLISLKAGGSGLNLTSANIVIHFDPWWNPAIEDQASDRAHRMGQKKVIKHKVT